MEIPNGGFPVVAVLQPWPFPRDARTPKMQALPFSQLTTLHPAAGETMATHTVMVPCTLREPAPPLIGQGASKATQATKDAEAIVVTGSGDGAYWCAADRAR